MTESDFSFVSNSEIEIFSSHYAKCTKILTIVSSIFSIILLASSIALCVIFFFKQKESEFEFIYINDIHLDPLYKVDNSKINGNFSKCRISAGSGNYHPFGQYGCDLSNQTFQSMIKFLPKTVKNPQFILFGGDASAHSLNYTREELHDLISYVVNEISSVFPNVPFLFALGNNEFIPNYGSDDFSTDTKDFASISTILSRFMNEDQLQTFQKGGYYYHDFVESKLRLLIVNSIIYNGGRDYQVDPYDQFQWIYKSVIEAHRQGLRVGICTHISPGLSFVSYVSPNQVWKERYHHEFNTLINEVEIDFILSGHIHYDMLISTNETSKQYSLSAPAVSPQHTNNPSFRVFKYSEGHLLNYIQYYADIGSNPTDDLEWKIEYTFQDAYRQPKIGHENIEEAVNWITNTNEGRWSYIEKLGSFALEDGKLYYCLLKSSTLIQLLQCTQNSKITMESISKLNTFFPYSSEK